LSVVRFFSAKAAPLIPFSFFLSSEVSVIRFDSPLLLAFFVATGHRRSEAILGFSFFVPVQSPPLQPLGNVHLPCTACGPWFFLPPLLRLVITFFPLSNLSPPFNKAVESLAFLSPPPHFFSLS